MKWDIRFLQLAELVASWSKDPSTKCGSAVVRPDRTVASLGFNGFPRGVDDTDERLGNRETKLLYTVHAEANAILTAREPLNGCTLYVWPLQPCASCAAAIIQSGIGRVVCPHAPVARWSASFEEARKMFSEAEVQLVLIP